MTTREEYTVAGMTCGHCVQSVTSSLTALPGVTDVEIDLPSGGLVVHSDVTVSADAVREAVDEAGYSVVS